jgi:hypothetical protein
MAMGFMSTDEHRRERIPGQHFGEGRDHDALTSLERPRTPLRWRSVRSTGSTDAN